MPIALSDLMTNLRTKIETDFTGLAPGPAPNTPDMVASYDNSLEHIVRGQARYQLRGIPNGRDFADSNATRRLIAIEVEVRARLAYSGATADERAVAEGSMLTNMELLTNPSWWRAVAEIYQVTLGATFRERIADELRYGIAVQATTPD